jgi:osmotically-inducible protein OsmY
MPRKSCMMVPATLGLALAIGAWVGADEPKNVPPAQQPKGAGQTIGQAVENAVQGVKSGARATTEAVAEQIQQIRNSVHDQGVHARVYSRLHWDKSLQDCRIDVDVKDGTAILQGTVHSLQAKGKAAELARDTLGVDRVDDRLTIEPATPEHSGSAAKAQP